MQAHNSFEWQAAVWLQVELDGEGPSRLPRLGMGKVNGIAGRDTVIAIGLHILANFCRGLYIVGQQHGAP